MVSSGNISVWIFQSNPKRFNAIDALSDGRLQHKMHWLVTRYQKQIKQGHLGLIWNCGKDAGIYALARVESDPQYAFNFPEEEQYWLERPKEPGACRVELAITRSFPDRPILKQQLSVVEGLQGLSILNYFQATNFPVTDEEWRLISDLIDKV